MALDVEIRQGVGLPGVSRRLPLASALGSAATCALMQPISVVKKTSAR